MEGSKAPPRGWYDDPEVPGGQRYWDGSAWTKRRARPRWLKATYERLLPDRVAKGAFWFLFVLVAVLAAGLINGAVKSSKTSSSTSTSTSTATTASAGSPAGTHVIPIALPPDTPRTIPSHGTRGSFEGVDYDAYAHDVAYDIYLISQYWSKALPDRLRVKYTPDPRVLAYDLEDSRPYCDGTRVSPGNADYCITNNTVAFDEPGLLIPFYKKVGPAADAVILAHEWGHAVQARLELTSWRADELRELNADCWAGVWAGDEILPRVISRDDLFEAAHALYLVGDPHSVSWRSPQAHGTPQERFKSFGTGVKGGIPACVKQANAFSD